MCNYRLCRKDWGAMFIILLTRFNLFNTFIKFGGITFFVCYSFCYTRNNCTEISGLSITELNSFEFLLLEMLVTIAIFAYGSNGFAIGGSIASVIMLAAFLP